MKIVENASLLGCNTFGIDVKAHRLLVVEPCDSDVPVRGDVLVVGKGSDIVFTRDYEGTVLTLADTEELRIDGTRVEVWCGMRLDRLVELTLEQGLFGLENLSAIPGTVGGAVVQNAGAYGAEVADVLDWVEALDLAAGRLVRMHSSECRFGYRSSLFKQQRGRYLILRASLTLNNSFVPNLGYAALAGLPHATASELRTSIVDMRWQKLPKPEEHGSAGSFFKNPVVSATVYESIRGRYPDMPEAHRSGEGYKLSAGWLVDRAGWKGRTEGRVGVWPKNALVLYNTGGCTGNEVVALAKAVKADVSAKFGVDLEEEAIII